MSSRLLLVDGPNLTMRAIHAMARSGLDAGGTPTGALHSFVLSLAAHVREEQPTHVAVVWEGGRSRFRLEIDPGYKAHRTANPEITDARDSAFSLIKEFLALAGVFSVERAGYEADDLIAWYVSTVRIANTILSQEDQASAVILSSDKDFLQLLGPQVEQVRLSSAGTPTDRWTVERVEDVMGCSPTRYAMALALAGDESDGVPGVPRFGIKTAVKTLSKHDWSWEDTLTDPKVEPHEMRAQTNLALVQLLVPQAGLTLPQPPIFAPTGPMSATFEPLLEFIERYRLNAIRSRLYESTLWRTQHQTSSVAAQHADPEVQVVTGALDI